MNREVFRKLINRIKRPHGVDAVFVLLLFFASLAGDILFISFSPEGRPFEVFAYIFYGISAILLGYLVYICVIFGRNAYRKLSDRNKLLGRLRREFDFRTIVFSVCSCLVATSITVYYGVLFGLSLSVWYGALGGYYLLLALARGGVLLSRAYGRKRGESGAALALRDAQSYFGSGSLLVALAFAFSSVLTLTVTRNYYNQYAGLTIYVAAAYAFWKGSFAVYNFIKAHKREDLTVRTLRNINAADALVSIVALQSAMLQTFMSEGDALNPRLFNAVTGGIACLLIIVMGSFMIVRGYELLRRAREVSDPKK